MSVHVLQRNAFFLFLRLLLQQSSAYLSLWLTMSQNLRFPFTLHSHHRDAAIYIYNKAIALNDPAQSGRYPAALCHRTTAPRVRDGGKLPLSDNWYQPSGEGSTLCNTASERPPPRVIWGKASHTNSCAFELTSSLSSKFPMLELTWVHVPFFLRPPKPWSSRHTYRILQGPSRLRQRGGAFSACVGKYWNRFPSSTAMSSLRLSLIINGSYLFLKLPISFCSPTLSLRTRPPILFMGLFVLSACMLLASPRGQFYQQ